MSIPRKNSTIQKSNSENKKVVVFILVVKMTESRPAWTRMVAVVYGSEGGELGFPSAAQ